MKTSVVVLAAGNSSRFKGNKLLSTWKGRPFIEHSFLLLERIAVHNVYVVTQYDKVCELAKKYDYHVIKNIQPELGMSHSIALGVEAAIETDQILFMVADQPFLTVKTLQNLIDISDGEHITCCTCESSLQNPMIFPKHYYPKLLLLTKEQGGRYIAKQEECNALLVEAKQLMDIDTQEEYEKASLM